jgi:hypothetical protein
MSKICLPDLCSSKCGEIDLTEQIIESYNYLSKKKEIENKSNELKQNSQNINLNYDKFSMNKKVFGDLIKKAFNSAHCVEAKKLLDGLKSINSNINSININYGQYTDEKVYDDLIGKLCDTESIQTIITNKAKEIAVRLEGNLDIKILSHLENGELSIAKIFEIVNDILENQNLVTFGECQEKIITQLFLSGMMYEGDSNVLDKTVMRMMSNMPVLEEKFATDLRIADYPKLLAHIYETCNDNGLKNAIKSGAFDFVQKQKICKAIYDFIVEFDVHDQDKLLKYIEIVTITKSGGKIDTLKRIEELRAGLKINPEQISEICYKSIFKPLDGDNKNYNYILERVKTDELQKAIDDIEPIDYQPVSKELVQKISFVRTTLEHYKKLDKCHQDYLIQNSYFIKDIISFYPFGSDGEQSSLFRKFNKTKEELETLIKDVKNIIVQNTQIKFLYDNVYAHKSKDEITKALEKCDDMKKLFNSSSVEELKAQLGHNKKEQSVTEDNQIDSSSKEVYNNNQISSTIGIQKDAAVSSNKLQLKEKCTQVFKNLWSKDQAVKSNQTLVVNFFKDIFFPTRVAFNENEVQFDSQKIKNWNLAFKSPTDVYYKKLQQEWFGCIVDADNFNGCLIKLYNDQDLLGEIKIDKSCAMSYEVCE